MGCKRPEKLDTHPIQKKLQFLCIFRRLRLFSSFFDEFFQVDQGRLTFERLDLLVSFHFYRVYLSFSYRAHRCGFVQIYSKVIEFIQALTSGRIAVISSRFIHQIIDIGQICRFSYAFWPLSHLETYQIDFRFWSDTFVISRAGLDLFLASHHLSYTFVAQILSYIHDRLSKSRFCHLVYRLILPICSFTTRLHLISFCRLQYRQNLPIRQSERYSESQPIRSRI